MNDVNNCVLIGRLTRDAELNYTKGGTAHVKMSVAVNESRKDGDNWVDVANFFDCELWGKRGESLAPYMLKGKQVAISGGLQQQRWKDNEGGSHSKVVIVCDTIQLLGGNSAGKTEDANGEFEFKEDIPF